MRLPLAAALLLSAGSVIAAEAQPGTSANASSIPVGLDPNFSFRKTKIFTLSDQPIGVKGKAANSSQTLGKGKNANQNQKSVAQEASMTFERSYRLYGAVTVADQHQRYGQYFDFFWRARRPADVRVRFEYKQEKLRAFTQAKEVSYRQARGTNRTEFRVVGDEFLDDGKVLAWRCLLIEHSRIVAEKRSFLWD